MRKIYIGFLFGSAWNIKQCKQFPYRQFTWNLFRLSHRLIIFSTILWIWLKLCIHQQQRENNAYNIVDSTRDLERQTFARISFKNGFFMQNRCSLKTAVSRFAFHLYIGYTALAYDCAEVRKSSVKRRKSNINSRNKGFGVDRYNYFLLLVSLFSHQ